jgi:hypothetical protein
VVLVLMMSIDVVMREVGDGRHILTTPVMHDRQPHWPRRLGLDPRRSRDVDLV